MAILSGGPNSGFSGKVGSVVGYYRLGKWVIRSRPRFSPKNKKGTPEQNFNRGKLGTVQRFLSPIISFIRVGFNLEARKRGNTAHNSASSWNMLHAFDEDGRFDYSKTRVSMGSLQGPDGATITLNGQDIIVTWVDNSGSHEPGSSTARASDQVMLLASHFLSPRPKVESMLSGARRSSCQEKLTLPSGYDEWHVWMAFISDDRESISNSQYLGKLTVDS